MSILFCITGILFALILSFIFSYDRKAIDFKKPLTMLVIQVIIVIFMMNTTIGLTTLTTLGSFFESLLDISKAGIDFVFGGLQNKGASTFYYCITSFSIYLGINRCIELF